MSWHTPGPSVGAEYRSLNPSSCHAPGPVVWTEGSPQPGLPCPASSEPRLTTCGLCPEPGLVSASTLSNHLLKEHPGEAFECAACKVVSPDYMKSTGYHSKYWQFFQCYIIPLKKPLGFKVRSVLESSYHWLSNGHWNFVIITKNDRENWV